VGAAILAYEFRRMKRAPLQGAALGAAAGALGPLIFMLPLNFCTFEAERKPSEIVFGLALVGVGNLGRAMLAYFQGRRPRLSIVAAFDSDPAKYGRVIQGCRCYSLDQMEEIVRDARITVGVITVPASEAQRIANRLVSSGVTGIINYAPVPLWAPPHVYVEDIDMTMSLEKVAYFARTIS